jgi:hypothetical protein
MSMSDENMTSAEELELAQSDTVEEIDESKAAPEDRATAGPFDISEVPTIRPYIDFGAIKIVPREGLQLRLEVDERAKRVVAVTLDFEGSLLQVQAFSAPKKTGLWHRVRGEISQQFTGQGAPVSEEEGALGPELVVVTPVSPEQGGGSRTVRFLAVDGPRWMLRGVVTGKAADDAGARERLVEIFRDMVVVRGEQPLPPSDLLPLQVPAGVAQGGAPGSAAGVVAS